MNSIPNHESWAERAVHALLRRLTRIAAADLQEQGVALIAAAQRCRRWK